MPQVVLEVDVQPFTACASSLLGGDPYQMATYALQTGFLRYQGVEDERVTDAIPCHVDEAYELLVRSSADPAETPPVDLAPPVVGEEVVAKTLGVQHVDLGAVEVSAPVVADHTGERSALRTSA